MSNPKQSFVTNFFLGVNSSLKAFRFVFENKLGHYFIYPIIITILLIFFTKIGIDLTVDWVTQLIYEATGIEELNTKGWPESWTDWGKFIGEKTVAILLWIMMFFIAHKIIKYVVLILMSPVMALLSERTEKILTGNEYPFSISQLLKDVWRGVLLATRNIFVELGILILIWMLNVFLTSFFPPITIITTPLSFILGITLSSYFYGFATIDYFNERRKFNIYDSYHYVRQNKGIAVGNGFVFWGLINIPILGTYIGTVFAPILCSTGAVLALYKKDEMKKEKLSLLTLKEKNQV